MWRRGGSILRRLQLRMQDIGPMVQPAWLSVVTVMSRRVQGFRLASDDPAFRWRLRPARISKGFTKAVASAAGKPKLRSPES